MTGVATRMHKTVWKCLHAYVFATVWIQ